jgi:hypothetical protein
VRFDARLQTRGVDAPAWRRRYHTESTRRERVASDLAHWLGPVELSAGGRGLSVSDLDELEKPVVVKASGEASARKEGDAFSLTMGPTWSMVARYATRPSRKHDLLAGPRHEQVHTWTVEIPAAARVLSLPKAQKQEGPFGSHELTVRQEGRSITVTRRLRLDRARIAPANYAAWRAFCEAVDAGDGAHVLVSM